MKELKKTRVLEFIKYLENFYDVFLPIKKDTGWSFGKLDSETELVGLKPVTTILPPKKFLLPNESNLANNPVCIVGINSFDINALALLDQIMLRPYQNSDYIARRKKTLIIGSGPERINLANSGFDLFLEEHEDSFLAISGTSKGSQIEKLKFFTNTDKKPKKILSFKDPVLSQSDKIKTAIEKNHNSKIWEKVAETCLGCGICSYVCPLCYCYETNDHFKLDYCDNKNCGNCENRRWDACFLPNFFEVSGHNFRDNLASRIYNWYYHKFVRMPKEYGFIGCIDCGRCIEFCPAKINFKEVLKELIR
jgi:sulfhydrogenase subunit beta (sulfur reductase)